ncbi:AAA family ATPase [Duganella sp. PWIR1]
MIEKFESPEEQCIRLRNVKPSSDRSGDVPQLEQNLFSIDSLSLVIGNNGSGKTRLLEAMWDSIDTPAPENWQQEWNPTFIKGTVGGANEVGVILFSLAPDKTEPRKSDSKRCVDASPIGPERYSPELVIQHREEFKHVFPPSSHLEADFHFSPGSSIRRCLELIMASALDMPPAWVDLRQQIADFEYSFPELTSKPNAWSQQNPQVRRVFGSGADSDARLKPLVKELFDQLRQLNKASLMIWLTAIHAANRKNMGGDALLMHVFSNHLGLTANPSFEPPVDMSALAISLFNTVRDMTEGAYGYVQQEHRSLESIRFLVALDGDDGLNWLKNSLIADIARIGWTQVSSGQWAIINQFIKLEMAFRKLVQEENGIRSILVLIDEGDAFLHLEWQREYISQLDRTLARMRAEHRGKIAYVQAVIATHSPLLASDVPGEYVNRLVDGKVAAQAPAFAAPFQLLMSNSFGARSIGALATHQLRETVNNIKIGKPTDMDRYILSIVDDPILKRELAALMNGLDREPRL